MKTWQKLAAVTVVVAAMVGGGGAWAAISGGADNGPSGGSQRSVKAGSIDTSTEAKYTAITPCRIVDTRQAGGPIGIQQTRSFRVRGTQAFVFQGGKSGGCGIPAAATSIEATVTAIDSPGTGFVRIYPDDRGEPNATFLNFTPADISNTGAISLDASGITTPNIKAKVFGNPVHLVIDVQGYFIKPMFAVVTSGGALARGSRVTSIAHDATGNYRVRFDRNITGCAFSAVLGVTGALGAVRGEASSAIAYGATDQVFVLTTNSAGTNTDLPFHLIVTC